MNDGIYDLSINDDECNNWNNDKLEANQQLIKGDIHRTIQETNQLIISIYSACKISKVIKTYNLLSVLKSDLKWRIRLFVRLLQNRICDIEGSNFQFWDEVHLLHTNQTSTDSTVRVLSLSRFRPDFPENRVRCLSPVRIPSEFSVRFLSVRILSVRIMEKSCPLNSFWSF